MTKKFIVEVDERGAVQGQPQELNGTEAITTKVVDTPRFIPWHVSSYIYLGISIIVLLVLIYKAIVLVQQQKVKVVERLGKYKKIMTAGLNFKIPFIDRVVSEKNLRLQQLDVDVETKTKDNVFVTLPVSIQLYINPERVYDAHYKLADADRQISAYIFDTVRAQVPKMSLDEVFEKKEDIAKTVKEELQKTMDDYGYTIITALVTDINPADNVKKAMNEINAQSRLKEAAKEKGEADKILKVKDAEAEAESKALQGKGIANERIAIAEGLEKSMNLLKAAGITNTDEVLNTLMLTQYFDTIKNLGDQDNTKVIFLPHSPGGMTDLHSQIRNAIISGNEAGNVPARPLSYKI